jgi:hypothetical protein
LSLRTINIVGGFSSFISGVLLFLAHLINLAGKTEYGTVVGSSLVFIALNNLCHHETKKIKRRPYQERR